MGAIKYMDYTITLSEMGVYGSKYKYEYYPTEYNGEYVGHCATVEDCKNEIDELE